MSATRLRDAVVNGDVGAARMLIAKGVDVNVIIHAPARAVALHAAAECGHLNMVRIRVAMNVCEYKR